MPLPDNGTKNFQGQRQTFQQISENSSKNDSLDFSSINTRMVCALPNLQSRILDHLFLFLQCANEDDQIQNIHSAVDGLTELYQEARPSDLSQESSVDKETYPAEAFLCMLWSLLAMIVRMIPYTHPKQELVLSFFKTLRERKVGIAFVWGFELQLWEEFPLLYPNWDDEMHSPAVFKKTPSPEERNEWLNLSSFTALLKREGIVHGTHYAIVQLRNALEERLPSRELTNWHVSVASLWIMRSGIELYREARDGGPMNDEPVMKRVGPLYRGEPGLCLERWLFWKSRFCRLAGRVDKEVAKLVQQAVGEMEKAEMTMKKPAMV